MHPFLSLGYDGGVGGITMPTIGGASDGDTHMVSGVAQRGCGPGTGFGGASAVALGSGLAVAIAVALRVGVAVAGGVGLGDGDVDGSAEGDAVAAVAGAGGAGSTLAGEHAPSALPRVIAPRIRARTSSCILRA